VRVKAADDRSFVPTPADLVRELIEFSLPQLESPPSRILVPGAGEGAFISGVLGICEDLNWTPEIVAVEIVKQRAKILRNTFPGRIEVIEGNFLTMNLGEFDWVVGNPPYTRYRDIPSEERILYNSLDLKSITGQYDLSFLFIEHALSRLRPKGVLSFITTNKFMINDGGKGVRDVLSGTQVHSLQHLDAGVFPDAKLAYPVMMVLGREASYQDTTCRNLEGNEVTVDLSIPDNWKIAYAGSPKFSSQKIPAKTIGDLRFGPATGRDRLFVRTDFGSLRDEFPYFFINAISGACLTQPNPLGFEFMILDGLPVKDMPLGIDVENARSILLEKVCSLFPEHVTAKTAQVKKRHPNKLYRWWRFIDKIEFHLAPKIMVPTLVPSKLESLPLMIDESGDFLPTHTAISIRPRAGFTLSDLESRLLHPAVMDAIKASAKRTGSNHETLQLSSKLMRSVLDIEFKAE
jgi:hypothetical protein